MPANRHKDSRRILVDICTHSVLPYKLANGGQGARTAQETTEPPQAMAPDHEACFTVGREQASEECKMLRIGVDHGGTGTGTRRGWREQEGNGNWQGGRRCRLAFCCAVHWPLWAPVRGNAYGTNGYIARARPLAISFLALRAGPRGATRIVKVAQVQAGCWHWLNLEGTIVPLD